MRRRAGLAALALLALACGRAGAPAPAGPQRVVLVSIDTLRADHVGCYGAEHATTPTLDALAARGARFETAISPAPLTLPAHSTLLTGLDPPEHGVRSNGSYRLRDDVPTLAERLHEAGFASAAFVSAFVLDRRFGLARGFDAYDDQLGVQDEDLGVASRPAGATVDAALAWLAQAPPRFLLFVHLYDPHAPYTPPEPYRTRQLGRLYDGEIAYADAELGRLFAALDARFPDGRSLVVVTADHGESLGEHGEPTHAFTVYDATQRIPLLIAGPGVPAGRAVTPLARLADVTPTLLELLGLPPLASATGRSLVPLLRGEAEAEPRVAWVETLATQLELGWSPLLGVRTSTHKYVRAPRPELYALADDPGETRNLAAEQPALVAELDALVAARAANQRTTPNLGADAATGERLRALGYLADAPASARPLGEVGGPDPKDEMGKLGTLREIFTALRRRHPREALDKFPALGELGPELELVHGEAALLAGELELARASVARARRGESGGDAAALVLLGRIEEAAGRLAEADAAFAEAERRDPDTGAAAVGRGRVAERRGDPAAARSDYERARGLRRVEGEALWRLAALEIESGDPERARAALAALPQDLARSPEAAARLAEAERAAGRSDLARIRVQGARRAAPDAPELLAVEGALLEDEGKWAEALAVRQRAYDAAPGDPSAGLALARSLALAGEGLDRAPALAEPALAEGRSPERLESLALVRAARSEWALALALAEEGLAASPPAPLRGALELRRAEALAGLGRGGEARAALAAGLRDAPPSPGVAAARGRIRRVLGDPTT